MDESIRSIAAGLRASAEHSPSLAPGAKERLKERVKEEPATKPKKPESSDDLFQRNLICQICLELYHDCVTYAQMHSAYSLQPQLSLIRFCARLVFERVCLLDVTIENQSSL